MRKEELIACFQDTLQISQGKLRENTIASIKSNKVYKENFVSKVEHKDEHAIINVHAGTTFDVAKKYCQYGKVAVLNFANPEIPGGVCNGAMAQEECLCRSSNLYACISNENVFEEYYGYHRDFKNYFYSDRLIYTKDVTVFKNDDTVPLLLPEEEWFDVDVITCAAPYIAKRKYTGSTVLLSIFKGRIKNIFEAAKDNQVDVIVLGAFGCGAFKNPPLIVAEAFKQVMCEENYFAEFNQIVFAIKPTSDMCPNLMTFMQHFDKHVAEAEGRCCALPEPLENRFSRIPSVLKNRIDEQKFLAWQKENKYYGKQFSIVGDSISTLNGYNPKGYKVFYLGDNCEKSGVTQMSDTWWDNVISYFGGELLINNSWSGSRVTKLPGREELFPSGCSDERTSSLHINNITPDVIIVYLGTNDWAFGANTGNEIRILEEDENEIFAYAYDNMLKKLTSNYPKSEIWCCTLSETYISARPDFSFPHSHASIHIEEYNDIIRAATRKNACKLIDLYSYKMPYDSIDGSHPTYAGMNTIAKMVIRSAIDLEDEIFLECKTGQYSTLPIEGCPETVIESEYVMLDPNITTMLYSNTIKLTIESSRKTVQFQKDIVNVGRDIESDLVFEDKKTISCKHATFIFENKTWFLRDNHSSNGTWLNGARMNPGKKYQLQANDEINFAMAEKVVFFKQDSAEQPKVDIDKKAIAFLEAGIATFAKSQQKDEVAFKLILAALTDAPLYFPVEIDVTTMFGSVNPENLKPGDTIQPQMDVKMKIRTLAVNDIEIVPMFTSNIEANKGPDTSIVRYYPQDYMPMLLQMDKPIVINPFSEYKFLLPKELISDLLPLLGIKKNSNNVQKVQTGASKDKYIGTTIAERYFVDRLLGEGGFYKTYLVEDKLLMRFLAMKVCDKTNRHYNELVRDMIFQEPHIMAKLKHPAIPLMVDVLEDDESILIFREYVEGVSLETIVKNSGAQPAEKVIEWAKELCDMLRYLHNLTQPHIYRDMKPANVLLMENQHLKVIDFGVVRIYDLMKDRDTCFLGTRGYAAPEQYGGSRQTDVRTDIFGLGMTMHHLVTGVDPKEPSYITKPICQINPSLPKGLEYIISKCIELNPDDRYQNCDELINDLNNYMNLPKSKGILGKLFGRKK